MKFFFFFILFTSLYLTNGFENNTLNNTNSTIKMDACSNTVTDFKSIFFIILLSLILIIGVIGNGFAIVIIVNSKRLRSHPTNIFIASLAATDLGAVLFVIPIRIDSYFHNQSFCFSMHICRLLNITDLIFHIGSVSHLFIIAAERFLAIIMPFVYQRYVTTRTAVICAILTWVYAGIWTGLGMFNWENIFSDNMLLMSSGFNRICINDNRLYFTFVYVLTYVIPLCIMGVAYFVILKVALKQARTIASLSPAYLTNANGNKNKNKHEMRATKTLAIVYGAFLICWLPITIITISSSWCPECYTKFRNNYEDAFKTIVVIFIETLPPLNSCMNPFVYILFNKQFRKASKILLYKILRQPINNIDSENYQVGRRRQDIQDMSDTTRL